MSTPRARARARIPAVVPSEVIDANPREAIGGNLPPEPIAEPAAAEPPHPEPLSKDVALSPFQVAEKAVNDIYDETMLGLDGAVIDCQELSDYVGNLMTAIRAAEALADATRIAENKVFDEGKAEVQARYKPLIANTKTEKGKTTLALAACKAALAPWLEKVANDNEIAAQIKRDEFDAKRRAAEAAIRATSGSTNLAERAAAEVLVRDAKKAETAAKQADKAPVKAGGAFGRSVTLRTVWVTAIADRVAAARFYWNAQPEAMDAFLLSLAEADVRRGVREISGVTITLTKVAV